MSGQALGSAVAPTLAPPDVTALWETVSTFALPHSVREEPRFLWIKAKSFERDFAGHVEETLNIFAYEAELLVRGYRRFLYLSALTDRPLTPSAMIDEVRRLHLADDRNVSAFLAAVNRDNRILSDRDRLPYPQTRALYAEQFGEPPPRAAWPPRWPGWTYYVCWVAAMLLSIIVGILLFALLGVLLGLTPEDEAGSLMLFVVAAVWIVSMLAVDWAFGIRKGSAGDGG